MNNVEVGTLDNPGTKFELIFIALHINCIYLAAWGSDVIVCVIMLK